MYRMPSRGCMQSGSIFYYNGDLHIVGYNAAHYGLNDKMTNKGQQHFAHLNIITTPQLVLVND